MSSIQVKAFACALAVLMPLAIVAKYNSAREFTLTDYRFKHAINLAVD